jgi:uncharacterized protein YggT (Ycf19 family)
VLLVLSGLKLVCEIALLALVGQGVLAVLAGAKREQNFFYQALKQVTSPFTWFFRRITPRKVADAHVPWVAFFMLSVAWVVLTIEKVQHCVSVNMVGCK